MSTKARILTSLVLAGLLLSLAGPTLALAHGGGHGHRRGGWGQNAMLDVAARELRTTPQRLIDQLRRGRALADLAQGRGMDPQHLVDAYLHHMDDLMAPCLEAGHLGQEQADWMLEEMREHAEWLLTHSMGLVFGWDHGPMLGFGWGHSGLIQAAAQVLDMSPWEIRAELAQGRTLAELAEERGVDPQAIVEAFIAERAEMLQWAVEAGYLTQEQADWMLEEMREHAEWLLTHSMPLLGFGHGHGGCH
ncbi:MAG: hypothetical protein ACE5MB_06605 [Anaerolineae bacterium]